MVIATHLIKVKGEIGQWSEGRLREYVDDKIVNEIDLSIHTSLEKFELKGNHAEVWVYIHAFPSEITQKVIEDWLKNHIKEPDVNVKGFEIVKIASLLDDPPKFFINLDFSKKQLQRVLEEDMRRIPDVEVSDKERAEIHTIRKEMENGDKHRLEEVLAESHMEEHRKHMENLDRILEKLEKKQHDKHRK